MIKEKRNTIILELLNENNSVSVTEIAEKCGVSEITVRRDLEDLASQNLIIRTHGGAVKTRLIEHLFNYDEKFQRYKEEKIAICKHASGYITDNDIVFIDCGTTLVHMAGFIKGFNNLTVITNSLPVASELINYPDIKLVLVGGSVISERKAIYGTLAEQFIARHHANKAFVGADGVSPQKGLSSHDMNEAAITLKMAENADTVYLLCDSSKIGRDSFVSITSLSKINFLITNKGIDKTTIKRFQKKGIQMITV